MPHKVVLLHDAHAAEGRIDSSDTLLEAQAVAAGLAELGYATTTLPVGLDVGALQRALDDLEPHAVVNLVESLEGRGQLVHVVPALLEALGVPFTGCSAHALGVTSHKLFAKELMRRAGVPTPDGFEGPAVAGPPVAGAPVDDGPWIVKSVFEHASLGLDDSSVVATGAVGDLIEARRAEFGGRWFAERFVPGRELNVALIAAPDGPRVLPVAEIRFEGFPPAKPAIVGYAAKWYPQSFEYRNTVRRFGVEPELAARLGAIARDCWQLFGLAGYARVDFRVDAAGTPWVLEVNANPCLSPDAGFAAALAQAGIAYVDAIASLVADARQRASTERP
ncbi:MAG TPA: D-alanine--D-alanine ligase [Gammaproteobacteria bacterium]|nr:D-alanine--D-alanine ligase [Gammaproteobacteria bacterium]